MHPMGTPLYMDPEFATGELTCQSDVYSFGIVVLHLLTGKPPVVFWQLWKARNNAIFRHEQTSIHQFLAACKATAELWRFRLPISKRAIPDTWCSFFHQARQGIG